MTEIDLRGRRAIVTGGGVGIGREIAITLAQAGADVAVTYMSHVGADVVSAIKECGRRGMAYALDVSDSSAVNFVFDAAADFLGSGIDILINNAGGLIGRVQVSDMSDEHWRAVLDVNLSGAFYCSRAALRHMNGRNGRIVNMSSTAGRNGGGPGAVAYATAKSALHGFTRGLAKEVGGRGITVNAIAPGLILGTPFHEAFSTEASKQAGIAASPLKRAGTPADVASAVLYLVSDLGDFVTGAVIDLNGGIYFS